MFFRLFFPPLVDLFFFVFVFPRTRTKKKKIVGAESTKIIDTGGPNFVLQHICAIRRIRSLENATVVVIAECNLGNEAAWLKQKMRKHPTERLCFMDEDNGKPGVRTTESVKEQMAVTLFSKLEDGRVCFHHDFRSITETETGTDLKGMIVEQLRTYNKEVAGNPPKMKYSGKAGGNKDDLAVALQLNLLFRPMFFLNKAKYGNFHRGSIRL